MFLKQDIPKAIFSNIKELASQFVIITDHIVEKLYGNWLKEELKSLGLRVSFLSFPSGEASKTREVKQQLEDALFEKQCGRDTCLIAFGGGVVSDLTGFIAATFCRGIPYVIVPTTLLGMVDASIGGKTGVNTAFGKNLVGAFYPAKEVFYSLGFLQSLPKKELQNGFFEMIKHGLIADKEYFYFLEAHSLELLDLQEGLLKKAVKRACLIKQQVVTSDFYEKQKRQILNYGHTVGHVIESLSNYSISHGQAVALGILLENKLAKKWGFLSSSEEEQIKDVLFSFGLQLDLLEPFLGESKGLNRELDEEPNAEVEEASIKQEMIKRVILDKKSKNQQPYIVVLEKIGKVYSKNGSYVHPIDLGEFSLSLLDSLVLIS